MGTGGRKDGQGNGCNEGFECHGVILIRADGDEVAIDGGYTNSYTMAMKTAISIPDDLFEAGEKMARKLKVSRSQLYQRALTRYLQQQGSDIVRESLDRVYAKESNRGLDPMVRAISEQIIMDEEW